MTVMAISVWHVSEGLGGGGLLLERERHTELTHEVETSCYDGDDASD